MHKYALVYVWKNAIYRKDDEESAKLRYFITSLVVAHPKDKIEWKIMNPGGIAIAGNADW